MDNCDPPHDLGGTECVANTSSAGSGNKPLERSCPNAPMITGCCFPSPNRDFICSYPRLTDWRPPHLDPTKKNAYHPESL